MTKAIKLTFNNFVHTRHGFSSKKFWFQVASIVGNVIPVWLLLVCAISGPEFADYQYKVYLVFIGIYVFGKSKKGGADPNELVSWKRFWFQISSFNGLVLPTVLLLVHFIDSDASVALSGFEYLDYLWKVVGGALTAYSAGKAVDAAQNETV